jgi:hypothetical protein
MDSSFRSRHPTFYRFFGGRSRPAQYGAQLQAGQQPILLLLDEDERRALWSSFLGSIA